MKTLNSPKSPRGTERELAKFTGFMIDEIAQRFKNQTLKSFNKGTIEKFEDAQVGNYNRVYLTMANRVRRKLIKQFTVKRINQQINTTLGKADSYNAKQTYKPTEKALGLNPVQLATSEGLTSQINALMMESSQWVKKLRDDTIEHFTANTMRAMSLGTPLDEIIAGFDTEASKRKNHAQFVARNQVANFNGISTKIRHQKLGIVEGVWSTSKDERVRKCHAVRDGKKFKLSQGLYSSCDGKHLLPGTDFNCRCVYRAVIPDEVN